MKITSFNPLIVTKDAQSAVNLFEELGFEKRHTKEQISLNNATGFILAVSQHTKDSD